MNVFEIPGPLRGKQRPVPNSRRKRRPYTPKQTVEYEKLVRFYFRLANPNVQPYAKGVPVKVEIIACFKVPESASEQKKKLMVADEMRPTKKPDYDNIEKIVCDALNGVAWYDDAQIVDAHCRKFWARDNYVRVLITEAKTSDQ